MVEIKIPYDGIGGLKRGVDAEGVLNNDLPFHPWNEVRWNVDLS